MAENHQLVGRMIHLSTTSIHSFQILNRSIYGAVNDIYYDPKDMMLFLGGYGGRFLKAVRNKETVRVSYWLSNATSWLFGLANKLGATNLEVDAWNRFRGVCPYCKSFPCVGSVETACKSMEMSHQGKSPWVSPPQSLSEFQEMLGGIYPFNTLKSSADHAGEEIFELGVEVIHFVKTSDPAKLIDVKEEAVDVLANFCGVATGLGLDLAAGLDLQFANGCPSCHEKQCACGYFAAKIV